MFVRWSGRELEGPASTALQSGSTVGRAWMSVPGANRLLLATTLPPTWSHTVLGKRRETKGFMLK